MAAGPVGVKHPAKILFTLVALLSAIAFILSLIAIFVPWSWKDTAVFERTYINLWQNCLQYLNEPFNPWQCWDNDLDQRGSVTGGDKKCRGYFVATQVFTIAGCVFAFLTLLTAAMILGKLWSKPIALAFYVCLNAFLAFSCIMVAFLMWIVYVEQVCAQGPLWPIRNYSWGWILMVVATFFAFLAMLVAYLGLLKVLLFKPFVPKEEPPMYPIMMDAPCYDAQPYYEPVAYEYPPISAPCATSLAPAVYPPVLATY